MDATLGLPILVGLIAVALAFDFLNGLHDAANSIATIVSTRVLPPRAAVFWAGFFNFIAFLFFGLHVAQTVGSGIVSTAIVDDRVIFGALMGAISWDVASSIPLTTRGAPIRPAIQSCSTPWLATSSRAATTCELFSGRL